MNPQSSHKKKYRALALLSGGLDSTVAIKLMLEQDIDVIAVNFMSPFCTCSGRKKEGCHLATQVALNLGVPIRVVHKGMEYLRIVENPRFGRGRGINPCIDCRIFMLRKTAQMLEKEDASFIVTGEVLGQRPMSQRIDAINLIEKESRLNGLILRPLSAHFFPPTIPEKKGIVDRSKLIAIKGRSRKTQIKFAKEHGLNVFGCPAGGCLLTDPRIAARMMDLFLKKPDYNLHDAKLATIGRHFRLSDTLKIIIGRDEKENEKLRLMAGLYSVIEFTTIPGPLAVICGPVGNEDAEYISRLMLHYTKHSHEDSAQMQLTDGKNVSTFAVSGCADGIDFQSRLI